MNTLWVCEPTFTSRPWGSHLVGYMMVFFVGSLQQIWGNTGLPVYDYHSDFFRWSFIQYYRHGIELVNRCWPLSILIQYGHLFILHLIVLSCVTIMIPKPSWRTASAGMPSPTLCKLVCNPIHWIILRIYTYIYIYSPSHYIPHKPDSLPSHRGRPFLFIDQISEKDPMKNWKSAIFLAT